MKENNEVYKKQDKRVLMVVIILSILVVGISIGGALFFNKRNKTNTNTVDNTTQTNTVDTNKTIDNKVKSKILDSGSLKSEITDWDSKFSDEKTITVNSSEHKISFSYVPDPGSAGFEYIKFDNKTIVEADGAHNFNEIYYYVVNGDDNVEYILIKYYKDDESGVIINENAKILKELNNMATELDCRAEFADSEEDRLTNPMIYVENGYIYYYKYMNGDWSAIENRITLEQIKVTISNDNISEIKMNNQKNASTFNCQ